MRGARWLALAALYFAAAKLSLSLATLHPSASPVWPPTGIALAAVLSWGAGVWPGIFAGAFLANLATAGSWATSLGIAGGNTAEALLGAWLLGRFAGGRAALFSARGITFFIVLAALGATTVSASAGTLSLALGGYLPWPDASAVWLTWWLGDATGALVVAPPLLLARESGERPWTPEMLLEAAALAGVLALFCALVFFFPPGPPLGYLCLPPVLWAAYRFGPREAAWSVALASALALWGTLRGGGPWGGPATPATLAALQGFFAALSVTGLVLAAVAAENRRARSTLETALRERGASLDETTASLTQAYEELEAFSYTVSHDLRAPLVKIVGLGELLEEQSGAGLDAAGRDNLRRMRAAARSLAGLVDALLELARFSRLTLSRERVDARALAEELAAELAEAHPDRRVLFSCRLAGPLEADPALLRALLRNLLSNAWKFTAGVPDARVELGERVEDGRRWLFVRDNGVGFPKAGAGKLFVPFSRLHTSAEFPGSGIGLAAVKRIAKRHGGEVRAEGAPGEGATVTFTL